MNKKQMEKYLKDAIQYIFHNKAPAKKKTVPKAKKITNSLPKPHDRLGYTYEELKTFLTSKELKKFNDWIYGQTCAINKKGQFIYYAWDVERFVDLVRKGKPTYWD